MDQYRLDGDTPVIEPDPAAHALWRARTNLQLAVTELGGGSESGGITVSTVFLGWDHSRGPGRPVLWESMTFGGPDDQRDVERYRSADDARAGHAAMVERQRARLGEVALRDAAPDLYEACRVALDFLVEFADPMTGEPCEAGRVVTRAMAKARGE